MSHELETREKLIFINNLKFDSKLLDFLVSLGNIRRQSALGGRRFRFSSPIRYVPTEILKISSSNRINTKSIFVIYRIKHTVYVKRFIIQYNLYLILHHCRKHTQSVHCNCYSCVKTQIVLKRNFRIWNLAQSGHASQLPTQF